MKQFFNLAVTAAMALIVASCSDNGMPDVCMETESGLISDAGHRIDPNKAAAIAGEVLSRSGKPLGRASQSPEISYVTSRPKSRGTGESNDTVAYIMNYPDNSGFVIVSADNRVYPVLAFSHSGSFSLDNEIARTQFVDRIESYVSSADPSKSYELQASDFRTKVNVDTLIKVQLDQDAPYNKYVVQNEGDYLVGCVAVASAYVMAYAKDSIRYNGEVFHLKSIIAGLGMSPKRIPPQGGNWGFISTSTPIYFHEKAMDEVARLLYWIGKNVNMSYGMVDNDGNKTRNSGAFSSSAYWFIKNKLEYTVSNYNPFNADEISQYLTDNYIIYMNGSNTNPKRGGHAWVSDGCYYLQSPSTGEKKDIYLHCNWGWGGSCNGYFTGDIFKPNRTDTFVKMKYFAVKLER